MVGRVFLFNRTKNDDLTQHITLLKFKNKHSKSQEPANLQTKLENDSKE